LIFNGEIKKGTLLFSDQKWLPIVLLGFSLIMVELGFLYAYRTGWKISTTSIIAGSFTTIALALIGVLWYKEEITIINIVDIVLSSVGVMLINSKEPCAKSAERYRFVCSYFTIHPCGKTAGSSRGSLNNIFAT
jgi:drug/metabolite transporter (DMT)-like permease